jgi:hypothetical protein
MQPSSQKFQDIIIQHLSNCLVTKADIKAADDIFGKNLRSLKGKTVRSVGVDAIPPEVLQAWRNVSIVIDITFVNKIPFFITLLREIKFGTVESIPDQQVTTIQNCLEKVVRLYKNRGLTVSSILADSKFEPIRPEKVSICHKTCWIHQWMFHSFVFQNKLWIMKPVRSISYKQVSCEPPMWEH